MNWWHHPWRYSWISGGLGNHAIHRRPWNQQLFPDQHLQIIKIYLPINRMKHNHKISFTPCPLVFLKKCKMYCIASLQNIGMRCTFFFFWIVTLIPSTEIITSTFFFLIPLALNSYWKHIGMLCYGDGWPAPDGANSVYKLISLSPYQSLSVIMSSRKAYPHSAHCSYNFNTSLRPWNLHAAYILK